MGWPGGIQQPWREYSMNIMVVVQGQTELPEVARALDAIGRLACALHRHKQQTDQNRNNGDHDQQLDERKGITSNATSNHPERSSLWIDCHWFDAQHFAHR